MRNYLKTTNNIPVLNKIIKVFFLFLLISCQPQSKEVQHVESIRFRFLEQNIAQIRQGYNDGSLW
jgi:hypothetical protein